MKELPYGISDFTLIRKDKMYYVDKTMYLPLLEKESNYLLMLRPRRFGKSLFLSMLDSYYDINMKASFNDLFGDLWIGHHPTPRANTYQIVRFDFSFGGGKLEDLEDNFNRYCCTKLDDFMDQYGKYYEKRVVNKVLQTDRAVAKLDIITTAAKRLNHRLYLIIDEYDNFTNSILASYGHEKFEELTHAEGFYRDFFKHFKGTFERIFMTGVSPVTLDDLTSGYNINWNISNLPKFNSMLGFKESDVRQILLYYREHNQINCDIESIISDMKPWCDNYCFALKSYGKETVYNCDMALYYLRPLLDTGEPPEELIDENVRRDTSKFQMLVDLDKGIKRKDRISTVEDISETGFVDFRLTRSFPAKELFDRDNFLSLMYYYGMLTIGGGDSGRYHMIIPNQWVRQQYWSFILKIYKDFYKLSINVGQLDYSGMMFNGAWQTVIEKIGTAFKNLSSVRDVIGGEHNVLGFFKAMLGLCPYSILCPEIELNYGYSDFLMLPLLKHFPQAENCYIFEIKYVKEGASEAEIRARYNEAESQIQRYTSSERLLKAISGCILRGIIILFRGLHMETPRLIVEKEISPGHPELV